MTGAAKSTSQVDQVVRGLGVSADNTAAAAMQNGNSIVAPVTRDHRFQHYSPDRFSILRTASSSAERFEIRLHSLVHRETSQRLAIIPGKEIATVGRDIRIEVHELAVIDLAWPQLVSLRDELTRAIAAAVPIAPDKAAERLAHLTAQIAVTESQLSQLAWKAPEAAATPSARELARLSDKIGMLVDRLEPSAVGQLRSPYWSGKETFRGSRGRWRLTAQCGLALLGGIIGLLTWSMAGEGLRAWSRLQSTDLERSSMALPAPSGGSLSDAQAGPAPSLARAGGSTTLMTAPAPTVVQEPPTRLTAEQPKDVASSSLSDGQRQALADPKEPQTSLGAAVPVGPAPLSSEPKAQTGFATEAAIIPPAVSLVAGTQPLSPPTSTTPASPLASGARMPEVRTAGSVARDAVNDTSAVSEVAPPHVAIHVTAETWLRVRDGSGRNYIARLLKAGETWPVPPIRGLVLTSGNSGSTFILIDGVSGPAFGAERAVRTEKLP